MILLVLIALAARVDASPADDARPASSEGVAEAIRYANILTGDDPDEPHASDLDDDDDDERGDDDERDGDECDDERDDGCDSDDRNPDGRNPDGYDPDGRTADSRVADGRNTDGRLVDDHIAAGRDDSVPDTDDRDADGRDRVDDGGASSLALASEGDDEPDSDARFEDMSLDLAGAALAGHVASELAMLDAGAADGGAVAGDDVSFAVTSAGAAETYESWMRHQRPSPWGRLDVGIAWRTRWSEPMSGMSRRYDEVWLVATWRR